MAIKKFKDFVLPKPYFVLATFDLGETKELDSSVYTEIEKGLKKIGLLKRYKTKSGEVIELPYNTFIGKGKSEEGSKEIRLRVSSEVGKMFEKLELKGRFMVMVGREGSGNIRNFNYSD